MSGIWNWSSELSESVIGVLRCNEARPFPRSWHRFPPIAGVSDMAGTGGGWGGAARGLFSEPVSPRSTWKKSQDEAGGRRRGGQERAFSPQTRWHLRLLWRRTPEIFHPGHCGCSPSIAVQPHLSFVILVQLGLIYYSLQLQTLSTKICTLNWLYCKSWLFLMATLMWFSLGVTQPDIPMPVRIFFFVPFQLFYSIVQNVKKNTQENTNSS